MRHLTDDPHACAALQVGLDLARHGELDEALRMFDRAAVTAADDPRAHAHRATCLVKLERLAESVDAFDAALAGLRRAQAECEQRRGNVLVRLGRHREACDGLKRATELDPTNADAWYDFGVSLLDLGLLPDAASAFERAALLDEERTDAWMNLASAQAAAGRFEHAARALETASARDPSDLDILFQLGLCRSELGRYDAALEAYDRALALDDDDADVWNNRGVVLEELGRMAEAAACYSRALSIDPDLAEAAENRDLLRALDHDGRSRSGIGAASASQALGRPVPAGPVQPDDDAVEATKTPSPER